METSTCTAQYLDDIAFIASSPDALSAAVTTAAQALQSAGFLLSPKSVLTAHSSATFIGKHVDALRGTISSLPAYYASILVLWLTLATGRYSRHLASRLLGKIIWLSQPHRRVLPFLAGPYATIHHGPSSLSKTNMHFTRATLEALAMTFPAWRAVPEPTLPDPASPRFFADAARAPWGTYFVGVWEVNMGTRFFPCPPWVLSQQAAELFAAYRALTLAAFRRASPCHLYLDNHAAIYSLLRGRAHSSLLPQNRILRRVSHLLHWSRLSVSLQFVPSHLNFLVVDFPLPDLLNCFHLGSRPHTPKQ